MAGGARRAVVLRRRLVARTAVRSRAVLELRLCERDARCVAERARGPVVVGRPLVTQRAVRTGHVLEHRLRERDSRRMAGRAGRPEVCRGRLVARGATGARHMREHRLRERDARAVAGCAGRSEVRRRRFVARAAVGAGGVGEREARTGKVAVRAFTPVVMWRLMACRTLHVRLVVAALAEYLRVPRDDRGLHSCNRRGRGVRPEDPGCLQRDSRDHMAGREVTVRTRRSREVFRVGEEVSRLLGDGLVASHAPGIRELGGVCGEPVVGEEVVPYLLQCGRFVREMRQEARIHMAVDAIGPSSVPAGLPCGVVRAHLMAGRAERRLLCVGQRAGNRGKHAQAERGP